MHWPRFRVPSHKLGDYAVAGVAGHLVVRGAVRVARSRASHGLLVGVVADGIAISRRVGAAVEQTRLRAGDVYAEALTTLGEDVPPPPTPGRATDDGHDHGA